MAIANGTAPEQPEEAPLRKLRRTLEAATLGIDRTGQALRQIRQGGVGEAGCRRGGLGLGAQGAEQELGVVANLAGFFAIDVGDLAQDIRKAWATIARGGWKIGTPPEGACLAIQEHGQRPSPLLA